MSVHKDKRKKLSVRSNYTELMLDFKKRVPAFPLRINGSASLIWIDATVVKIERFLRVWPLAERKIKRDFRNLRNR